MSGTLVWDWSTHPLTTSGVVNSLIERRILFVGGKGGVGKTTTAAALATVAAERGRSCLLVSTDPAHSLGDIFGQKIGDHETQLAPDLTALEIDPDHEATSHIETVKQQMKSFVHPRLYTEIDRQLNLATHAPGATEAALLERVAELMATAGVRYDLVIFDTAPSGHTVRLLSLPEVLSAWTDGLLKRRRQSDRFSAMLGHLGGARRSGDDLSQLDTAEDYKTGSVEERVNALLTARRRKFTAAREYLLDNSVSAFLLVLNADRLSILESQKVATTLSRFDISVSALVINRVLTSTISASGEFIDARRSQENQYLKQIDDIFCGLPRTIVPLQPHDVHGLEALRGIGAELLKT